MSKTIVRVPASSANVGSGMDSIGVAFHLYYTVIVEEETDHWQINHALGSNIPTDEKNLMVQTILQIDPKIHPHQLTVISDIPIAHGLGSSTTAVVAGIKIANVLGELNLSLEEQIDLGAKFEGHAENIAAAMMGNMAITSFDGKHAQVVNAELPDASALFYIRPDGISEAASRAKLPQEIDYTTAIHSSSVTNVFVGLVCQGKWEEAVPMVENDQFHEPYRLDLVPELKTIRDKAHELGIYGTYLSGAGPTIATFGDYTKLTELRMELQKLNLKGSLRIMNVDHNGTDVRGE
ncbi:homoserine kinase [Lentilactobacillus senioris]|uniref:Homoserine kinase n=1 Tax=Lentilactobacillus senioris DSM 24302 = JCM 17472 TaxID=1423802 RepID=A0A0R2CNX4_9LACO|nr:homoserine kinase [Lentilactobacillus senioris]KRM93390.1 homoserine kinase [Lentilactobacillus senioris DSM 24302 = JCM 17472]